MENNSTEKASGTGNSGDCKAQKQNPAPPIPSNPKSCKGWLFYSSLLHSKSKDPTCFGINGTYNKLSPRALRLADLEALRRGASSKDFTYSCLGYSIYFDDKNSSANSRNKTAKVPYCIGLEFLGYIPASTTESKGSNHATPQPQGRECATPQPRVHEHATAQPRGNSKGAHVPGEEFLNRFRRNMGIVALGVARNLIRVGNYVKENLNDILNSNRREPK